MTGRASCVTRALTAGAAWPVLVGLAALVGQVLLLRELIVLFNGYDISVGIMLAAWLAWTALGALLAGWIGSPRVPVRWLFGVAAVLCGLSLPITIWELRAARSVFAPVTGELLGPGPMLLVSLAALCIFCALSGALFALATRMYAHAQHIAQRMAVSYAYAWETAGAAAGGLLCSALLWGHLDAMQIATMVCVADLCMGIVVLFQCSGRRRMAAFAVAALAALAAAGWLGARMDAASQRWLWSGWNVLAARDSIYGRITVTEAGGMHGIYEDGAILTNVPDPAAAEESAHFALLQHPAPRRVLLIGGGMNGSLAEALRHPSVERLDYVELDPTLPALFREEFPADFAVFSDPRVHLHGGDGRRFLQMSSARFDAILVNVPEPATAQWNRFYTVEFFRVARARLTADGLIALQLRASEEYISPQRAELLRCMRHTLEQVFPAVVVLPGDPVHLFGALHAGMLTDDPHILIERLNARNLHPLYVAESSLPFRLSQERTNRLRALLGATAGTPVNRDFRPIAYYFSGALWTSQFSARYSNWLRRGAGVSWGALSAGLMGVILVILAAICGRAPARQRARAAAGWSALCGGYALMTVQIVLLLTFQCLYGYVYSALALVMGMFMAGVAVGTGVGIRRVRKAGPKQLLGASALIQGLAACAPPGLMLCITLLAGSSAAAKSAWIAPASFALLAFGSGIPGGAQFPLAAEIYCGLARHRQDALPAVVYALDLLGGCAGALLVSAFLAPLFGFWNAAWLAALLAAAPALPMAQCALARQPIEDGGGMGLLQTPPR